MKSFAASNRPELTIIVDDDVFEQVRQFKWRIDKAGYPVRGIWVGTGPYTERKRHKMTLHRHVMGKAPAPLVTDHINRNKLDNRRENLRFVTESVNSLNKDFSVIIRRRRLRASLSVGTRRRGAKFTAQIGLNGKIKHLGTFGTQGEASAAYRAAFENREKYGRGN